MDSDMLAGAARRRLKGRRGNTPMSLDAPGAVPVDRHRAVVFPNRIREQRLRHGLPKLLNLATALPDVPYIRLSKIERGEVFARPEELARIGAALGIDARELLVDVDDAAFDMVAWFAPFADGAALDDEGEARMAVLLAAALRARRDADPGLTASTLDREFDIPPVILSRIENAQKGLTRWNPKIVAALCTLFAVDDEAALRALVARLHESGALDGTLAAIPGADYRLERTRQRVAALRRDLAVDPARRPPPPRLAAPEIDASRLAPGVAPRRLAVFGSPMTDGLLAMTPTGDRIEAPSIAGPRAFGMRVCRATLGGGLPGRATVIADPDLYPEAGGLALVREAEGHRLVAVTLDRDGVLHGYSVNPDRQVAIDGRDPADLAAVVAAVFV
jgi:hypothetical protein